MYVILQNEVNPQCPQWTEEEDPDLGVKQDQQIEDTVCLEIGFSVLDAFQISNFEVYHQIT